MTTHLARLLDSFDCEPRNFTVGTLSRNGDNMDNCKAAHAIEDRWSIDSSLEMEHKVNSLRSLVCDLLKTNQELRRALTEARSGVPNNDMMNNPHGCPERVSTAKDDLPLLK